MKKAQKQQVILLFGQGSTKISKINKNLFDKNNYKFLNAVISPTNLNTGSENNKRITIYIPCKEKTTYTIQKKSSNLFNLGTTKEEPTLNMPMLQGSHNTTGSIAKITTLENANYLLVSFETDNNNIPKEEILDSLQIEIGDIATNKAEHEQTDYILNIQQEMLKEDCFIKEPDGWKEVHNYTKIESYNEETITTDYISTTAELTTGATIFYKSTLTKLPCTEEQSAVLEEINNLDLFEDVNNIITTEDIALLKLKYALDVKTYIDNLLSKQNV